MTDEMGVPVSRSEPVLVSGSVQPSAEFVAFLAAVHGVAPEGPTACPGWTAHNLLAHLVAGAQEITRLVDDVLAGRQVAGTRSFEEREAPLRAIPNAELRALLLSEGGRLGALLSRLREVGPARRVPFTGWAMTAGQLQTHVRSELAVHRWDLVGDDEVGESLLGQPDLLAHALDVRRHMTGLAEAARPLPEHLDHLPAAARLLAVWGRTRH